MDLGGTIKSGGGPTLRLVRAMDVGAPERSRLTPSPTPARDGWAVDRATRIARENHAAALGADDVRSMFASQVAQTLEGGRAAILRPEMRRELVAGATSQGLRPFDANLVIAITQDAARRGVAPTAPSAQASLKMVGPAETSLGVPVLALAAAVLAGVMLAAMVAWISSGG